MRKNNDAQQRPDSETVLRRLAEPLSWGRITAEGKLAVFVARNRFASPALLARPECAVYLKKQEWIICRTATADEWIISPLGLAHLRRADAADHPHRSQHQIIRKRMERTKAGKEVPVTVNEAETPLGWLLNRRSRDGKTLISVEQFAAGERMRRDFTLASLSPRVTAVWGLPVSDAQGGRADAAVQSDTVIAAKARLWAAFDAVGPGLGTILLQVCCYLNGLEDAERNLGWPARSGKVVLGIALDRLAQHYGMDIGGAPRPRRRTFLAGEPGTQDRGGKKVRNTQNNSCKA